MCEPRYFDVLYRINPWMNPEIPTDGREANRQWWSLYEALKSMGHRIDLIDPLPGQPDMVFTANAGVVIGKTGISSNFKHPYRKSEESAYHDFLVRLGINVKRPKFISEGSGDFLVYPSRRPGSTVVFAGMGLRTEPSAYREVEEHLGVEVIPLRLIDERFYHLDTALGILNENIAIVVEGAFSPDAVVHLRKYFSEVYFVEQSDALVLGANIVSDGRNVILDAAARRLAKEVERLGFTSVLLSMSELRKSGGGARCCVLELY